MKREIQFIIGMVICAFVGLIAGVCIERVYNEASGHGSQEVGREVIVDTIPYLHPVPVLRDSVVIRYETATLPLASIEATATTDSHPDTIIAEQTATEQGDSTRVLIPITQNVYREDSVYTAYVSGYHAKLDSIFVYPHREVLTIRKPPKRWSIGIQAGYGYTPKGFQPYLGIGITCRLAEF